MELLASIQDILILLVWGGAIVLIAVIIRLIWYITEIVKLAHQNLEILAKSVQKFDDLVEWGSTQVQSLGTVFNFITHIRKKNK